MQIPKKKLAFYTGQREHKIVREGGRERGGGRRLCDLGLFQVLHDSLHQRSIVSTSHNDVGGVVGVVSQQRCHVILWTKGLGYTISKKLSET